VGITTDENGYSTEGQAHIIVRKWRNAEPNLTIQMQFDGPKMAFRFDRGGFRRIQPEIPRTSAPANFYETDRDENPF
jgi:hypothetical protein